MKRETVSNKAIPRIIPLFVALLFGACNDTDESSVADEGFFSVSRWDEDLSELSSLTDQDTIALAMLDTCYLYMETDMDTCMITYMEKYLKVERQTDDDYWYVCTPVAVGSTSLFFMAWADRYYLPQTLTVQVDVSEGREAYLVHNTYTVESADSSGAIRKELMLDRIPNQNSTFYLEWTTTKGGKLVYRKSGGASTEGTFTAAADKTYSLVTEDWTLDVVLTPTDSWTYTFEQDLTEEFRQRYPDCGVEKVIISSVFSPISLWYTD